MIEQPKLRRMVYISGPLTNGGRAGQKLIDANVRVAMATADELMRAGYAPFCPHLTQFMHDMGYEHPHATWMEVDRPWVLSADCVLRLPGASSGADLECLWAVNAELPIYKSVKDLIAGEG